MSLSPGTRLGPYEVVAPLGAGGMGEVYRATDSNLGRHVALKVVSESFTSDPERVARFRREAQLLAALNHPHIATIHGLEESDGTQLLVMELVEGGTLADRLRNGALPVPESLAVARQVADALQAAHDKGIIHRDLKPANIAFSGDGQVKVLDFGLAKALEPAGGSAGDSPAMVTHSPTLSLAATQAGVILGTAAYMAPEQAKGKPADKRADIWAFGCVLYEMLTGTRPFDGEDLTEIVGAVVRLDPDWSKLPSELPLAARRLVQTCLTKDPRKRVVDATTALFVLEHAGDLAEHPAAPLSRGVSAAAAPRMQRVRTLALAAAAVALGASLAGVSVWVMTRPAPTSVVRTEIATAGTAMLTIQGNDTDLAVTADGSRIVYRGNDQLLVRTLDQLKPAVLSGLGSPRGPFVSPDGQWVGYFDGTSSLRKVAITGGPPVTIARVDGTGPRGATWGMDGTVIFASNAPSGLQRVSAAGGDASVLTKPDRERGELDHLWPEFLPGGRAVLFTITAATGGLDNAQLAVLDLGTGAYKVVVRGGTYGHYVSTGHLVYGAAGTLRAVPFDLERMDVVGTPAPVLEGVVSMATGGVEFAAAGNGTMVYVPGTGVGGSQRSIMWVDRDGREEPLPAAVRAYQYLRISPDGTRVALDLRDEDQDIWVWDLGRRTLTRLTFDGAQDQYPLWTPDSRRILFGSSRAGAFNIYWQAADGTGAPERISEHPAAQYPNTITSDGTRLIVREDGQRQDLTVLRLPNATSTQQPFVAGRSQTLVQTPFDERNAELSPDNRWLAYESTESGREEMYVRPFPDVNAGRWQVSTSGGRTALWSRNGRELFYVTPESELMGVRVEPGSVWRSTTPERILESQYFFGAAGNGRTYDISPDGRRFLVIKQGGSIGSMPQHLVVVQNWHEELKRLVPTN